MIRGLRSQLQERRPGRYEVCCVPKMKHLCSKPLEENEFPAITREPRGALGPRIQLNERKIPFIAIIIFT